MDLALVRRYSRARWPCRWILVSEIAKTKVR
jgi:hypothetical protein